MPNRDQTCISVKAVVSRPRGIKTKQNYQVHTKITRQGVVSVKNTRLTENKLNALRNVLDIGHRKATSLLDSKKPISQNDGKTICKEFLKFAWSKQFLKKNDFEEILKIEPAITPKRSCSGSPPRQTPTSVGSSGKTKTHSKLNESVFDDVKANLKFEDDDYRTTNADLNQENDEYIQLKLENEDLKRDIESFGRQFHLLEEKREELQNQIKQLRTANSNLLSENSALRHLECFKNKVEQLEFQVKLLTREKTTLKSEADMKYKALEDEYERFKADRIYEVVEDDKIRAGRYRAERNLAVLENKDLQKQIHDFRLRENELTKDWEYLKKKLTDAESDVQHKDLEIQSLNNRIDDQSQYIQEIQKRAEEEVQDANNAIVHYKEEEQRYKKLCDKANDMITKLKREKEEILATSNEDAINKKIDKIKSEKEEILSMLQKQKGINKDLRQQHKQHKEELSNELHAVQKELEKSKRDREEEESKVKIDVEKEELTNENLDMQRRLAEQSREHIEIEQRLKKDALRYKQERNRVIKKMDELKKEINELNEERKELQETHCTEKETLRTQIDDLKDKLSEFNTKGLRRYELENYQKETLDRKNEEIVILTRKCYELEEELKFSNKRKSVLEIAYEEMKEKFADISNKMKESEDRYNLGSFKRLSDIEKENESLRTELTTSLQTIEKLKQDYKNLEIKNEKERFKYRETLNQIQTDLSNTKLQKIDQREASREQEQEKQHLTSKIYSLESEKNELQDRVLKAEANMKQMEMIRDENEHLKKSLSALRKDVENIDEKFKTRTTENKDTITNLRDECERLKKEIIIARKETERIAREKDILAKKLQTEINVAKTEHDKLKKDKVELIALFKEESKKDNEKIHRLAEMNSTLQSRFKQQTEREENEDIINKLTKENDRLRNEENSVKTELQKFKRDNDNLKSEIQVLSDEYEQLKKKKTELVTLFNVESEKSKQNMQRMEREIETLRERCLSGEKAKQYNSYELLQLKNDHEICKKQKAQIEENLADVQQENMDLEKNLRESEEKYQHCVKKCDDSERKLEKLTKDYQELQERYTSASTEIHIARRKDEEHRGNVEDSKRENAKVLENLEKVKKEYRNLESQMRELEAKYQHCDEYRRKFDKLTKDHQELQESYKNASAEIKSAKRKNEELRKNVEDSKQESAEVKEILENVEKEKRNLESQMREYERKMNKLKKDHQELQDRNNVASTEIKIARSKHEELGSELADSKQETAKVLYILEKLKEEKNNLESQLREQEQEKFKKESGEIISLQRRINTLQSQNAELNQRIENKNKVQQETDHENRVLHARISQLDSNITELKQDKETLNSRLEVLREEKLDLEERIRRRSPQVVSDPRNCQNCWKYRNDISELKREVNDLRDRLSEAAGNRLRDNNPNIADLSDMNRPTSLAEKFNSLYTDEYTDAMEVIEDEMDETALVAVMLQWLKSCYDWCEKLAKEQRNILTIEPIGFMKKYCREAMDTDLSDRCCLFVKEFQKKIAVDVLLPVGKICIEKSVTEKRISSDSRIIKYIKKCSDLCWMMQIADPPMYLNFDIQQGQNLDKNYYNVFTKSGSKIDFLVWPILNLHKNGPMLAKGVAQGK